MLKEMYSEIKKNSDINFVSRPGSVLVKVKRQLKKFYGVTMTANNSDEEKNNITGEIVQLTPSIDSDEKDITFWKVGDCVFFKSWPGVKVLSNADADYYCVPMTDLVGKFEGELDNE